MATHGVVWLTEPDYKRLRGVLDSHVRQSRTLAGELQSLENLLDLARVVRSEEVPRDVVTMNSQVLFRDLDTGREGKVTIAYPAEADPASGRISVLSPVGTALVGATEGQEIELPLPHGNRRNIRIETVVYQPEAQGHFAL